MKGFLLDENNDIVIQNGVIAMVGGNDLKAQTLRTTMGTNKGEWFYNENEGINFHQILGKGITDEMILAQIQDACLQVDEDFSVADFKVETENKTRKSIISFKVQKNGETIATFNDFFGEETNEDAVSKLADANAMLAAYRSGIEKLERRLDGEKV